MPKPGRPELFGPHKDDHEDNRAGNDLRKTTSGRRPQEDDLRKTTSGRRPQERLNVRVG
jgi:hypothetical protein